MNSCSTCRSWKEGRCRASSPISAGPDAPSFFPLTAATDSCSLWAREPAVIRARVSDQEIVDWVGGACIDAVDSSKNYSIPRSSLMVWLTEDIAKPLAPTPALSRINTVVRRGLLGMGTVPPKEWPCRTGEDPRSGRVWLWPIIGAVVPSLTGEATRLRCLEAVRAGRTSVRTVAGAAGVSTGTAHTAVARLIAEGLVSRGSNGLEVVAPPLSEPQVEV